MDAISYFGDKLSEKIDRPSIACRGLIRFSLRDEVGSADNPDYNSLRKVFQNSLKTRLEKIGVENPNKITIEMVKELDRKQSLLTMSTV